MIAVFKNIKKLSHNGERTLALIVRGLRKNGLPAEIVNLEDIEIFLEKGKTRVLIGKKSILDYKMIYFRKVGTCRNVAFILSNLAKKRNIPFLDQFYPYTSTRGKLIQMFLLASRKLPIPKTYHSLVYNNKKIKNATSYLKLPLVVKATNFGGGRMVYLVKNKKEIKRIIKKHPDTEFILQEFIKNNFDYRIMVLGGTASVAEKRIRTRKKEFRNNACVGGKEIFLDVKDIPRKIIDLAIQAAKVTDVQIAGVDIVRDPHGKDYIFEVNPAPSLSLNVEGSYELDELVKYLTKCAKRVL